MRHSLIRQPVASSAELFDPATAAVGGAFKVGVSNRGRFMLDGVPSAFVFSVLGRLSSPVISVLWTPSLPSPTM